MLAILSSVTARDVSSLPRNVDAELLPGAGANAGFGIAGPLVLRNMIGPALASGLGANPNGIRPGQNGGMTLAGPINLPPLPGSGKTPTLSNVTATLKDTRVTIEYAGGMELAPGIRMTFNVDCDLEAAVATPEGPRPLGLRDDDPELRRKIGPARLIFQTVSRNHRHDVQEEWWFTAARKLAGGSFSWLTDQFFDQAINQTVEILVNVIDAGLARWAPSVIDLAPVLWSGQSKFSPASGQLAGGLVLRGTLA
jgi:hypothetical protein